MFWRNNSFLGVAFTDVEVGQNKAYFPAISMQKGQRAQFNFGLKPFTHGLSFSSLAINEPDCNINGYGSTMLIILDKLRLWLVAMGKLDIKCPTDEKYAVGCILVENLLPMLEDHYIIEIMVDFILETMALKQQADTLFKLLGLSFSNE